MLRYCVRVFVCMFVCLYVCFRCLTVCLCVRFCVHNARKLIYTLLIVKCYNVVCTKPLLSNVQNV